VHATAQQKPMTARAVAVAIGVAFITLAASSYPTSIAVGAGAPRLSIAVDNGRTTTAAGDVLEYSITIRNLDSTDVEGLAVTQTVPDGLRFESADAEGVLSDKSINWKTTLPAGGEAVHHSTMTVLDTSADLLRLATVACAHTAPQDVPIVCASHSDQLPAGAAAAEATRAVSAPTISSTLRWWYLTALAGLFCAGVAAVLTVRRRRKRQA
jgi:uncharacterized repeat protein (TIGR01451 family)